MKNGICPQCKGQEVYCSAGNSASQEAIILKGGVLNKGAAPEKYVCGTCGYLEYYLPLGNGNLEMIREHWDRVEASS